MRRSAIGTTGGLTGRAASLAAVGLALPGLALLGLALLAVGGCASTPPPPTINLDTDLHHPDPGRRALAVQAVATQGDNRYVPDLIELLDDRDEAVRFVASGALRELTGRDSEYRAFATRASRLEEIDAWRAWYESGAAAQGAQQ